MQKHVLRQVWITGIAVSLLIFSCKKDTQPTSPVPRQGNLVGATARQQLDASFANWPSLFGQTSLHPVSYTYQGSINSEQERQQLVERLMEGSNFVVQYDGIHNSSLQLNRLKDVQNQAMPAAGDARSTTTVASGLQQALDTLIKTGQQYATIQWKDKDNVFTSLCVYDNNGIVYDHILSNLYTVEQEIVPDSSQYTRSSQARSYSFTATAAYVKIKWVWGSKRGECKVTHSIVYTSSAITTNSWSASGWMSVGSASAQARRHKLARTYAQIDWGYGWATPTASFKITYNSKKATFEVSLSGVGSKGRGTGRHTIYL
jgi:hypothetical protein